MSSRQLLAELRRRDIALWVEDGQIRYRAPVGALNDALRAAVKEHREDLLRRLAGAADHAHGHYPAAVPANRNAEDMKTVFCCRRKVQN